jgi:hypothetical protein
VRAKNRDAIRRVHRPGAADSICTGCFEAYPCAAIELLDDLEKVEAVARTQYEQAAALGRRVEELEAKMRRAVRELS